jgi:hypothetical protein
VIDTGRLNAEVLNALGSEGEYVPFWKIIRDVRRSIPTVLISDVTGALHRLRRSEGIRTEHLNGVGWRKVVDVLPWEVLTPDDVAATVTGSTDNTATYRAAREAAQLVLAAWEVHHG